MKAALGIADSSSDAKLATLGLQISDLITRECRVPAEGVTPPTLRRETIVETLRLAQNTQYTQRPHLILSRRFVGAVSSVTVDGTALVASDYEIDKGAGLLRRLDSSGNVVCWSAAITVVTYTAGFETVPEPLKLAAITVLREQWSAASRDPLAKRETVDGIGSTEYWVNASTGAEYGAISGPACAMLAPYRYYAI